MALGSALAATLARVYPSRAEPLLGRTLYLTSSRLQSNLPSYLLLPQIKSIIVDIYTYYIDNSLFDTMDFITRIRDTGFIACKTCSYAIIPSQINFHFRKPPHSLDQETRNRLFEEVRLWPNLVLNLD